MLMEKEVLDANEFEVDALYGEFLEVIVNGSGYNGISCLLAQKLQVSTLIEDEFFRFARAFFFQYPHLIEHPEKKQNNILEASACGPEDN